MQFMDSFWNADIGDFSGWELVLTRLKDGKQTLKLFAEYCKQRSAFEEAHSKNLSKLSKCLQSQDEILPRIWEQVSYQNDSAAKSHFDASKRLSEEANHLLEVCNKLSQLKRSAEEQVRIHQQRIKLDWKKMSEAKLNYERKCKEEISCNQLFHQEIAKHGKQSREAEKARLKFDRCRDALKNLDKTYKLFVSECEHSRHQWETVTTQSLKTFQELEEQRIQVLMESIWKVSNILSLTCVEDDNGQEEIRIRIEEQYENLQGSLDDFIATNATGSARPEPIWYEPQTTSSSMGLSQAPAISTSPPQSSRLVTPPKPPRLIHYASSSLPHEWGRSTSSSNRSFPTVDSVDNIEYFNLGSPSYSPSEEISTSGEEYSSNSSDLRWARSNEKYIW